jgi:hypothetical protein
MLSLGSCNHTFITDCNNNNLRSADILSAAPGTARKFQIDEFPSDLQVVITKWGSLPSALRAAIVIIVKTQIS